MRNAFRLFVEAVFVYALVLMAADLQTRASLLLRLRDAQDNAAWSQFVSIYTPLIFAFCRGRGLSETDGSDYPLSARPFTLAERRLVRPCSP